MTIPPLQLASGQCHTCVVSAGTVIHLIDGVLRVDGPWRLLADRPWRSSITLHAGAVHVFDLTGWCELTSLQPCGLQVREPVHGLSLLHAGLRYLQRALRSHRRAAGAGHAVDGGLSSRV